MTPKTVSHILSHPVLSLKFNHTLSQVCFGMVGMLGLVTLSGCATISNMSSKPQLTPEQCLQTNWADKGMTDGMQGRSGAYFGQYIATCSTLQSDNNARIKWEEGRQIGLKKYCTELNAYQLGREGYDWQPVCPLEGIEKLEEAYSQGRYYYLRQQDMDYLTSPYPWGYGRFGYAPWGYRW